MASSSPIVTPDDLASFQGGDAQTLLDQATAAVRRHCGWHITPVITETVTVDGDGGNYLPLPSLNVLNVLSVTDADGVLDPADYLWSGAGYIRRLRDPRGIGFGSGVTVTLLHGYSLASVDDLSAVILARAARQQANPRGASRVQAGPFAEQYDAASGFSTDELATLRNYRIPSRP